MGSNLVTPLMLRAGNEHVRITTDGKVGIGTTNPGRELEIYDNDTNSGIQITDVTTNSGTSNGLALSISGAQAYLRNMESSTLSLATSGRTDDIRISIDGNVGIGTTSPTAKLDADSDTIRLRSSRTPASASAPGNAGDICWDANYIYICIAADTWKRAALSSW